VASSALVNATAIAIDPGTHASAASSCACREYATAATTLPYSNRGDGASEHSWRLSRIGLCAGREHQTGDDLVKALGMSGISKSQVSRLCQALDTEVERFRTRKLDGPYPFRWLDATFLKVRHDNRVVSMAVVIAVGVNNDGQREVLGADVGPSEAGAFWLAFLRGLVARGLNGVRLVTSDSHQGLTSAIAAVLQGASWQRCNTFTNLDLAKGWGR
jgi:hypothetical protein